MKNKPTALAIAVLLLQIMTWLNVMGFVILIGLYIYGATIGHDAQLFATITFMNSLPAAIVGLFFAILFHYIAKGILNQKKWARISGIVIGAMMLIGFPIGTAVGAVLIYGLTKGWPKDELKSSGEIQ